MATAPREIRVVVREGAVFRCRPDWTVDEAEAKIRAKYGLKFGGTEDQVGDLKGTDVIGNAVGDLTFVGGRALPPQPAARYVLDLDLWIVVYIHRIVLDFLCMCLITFCV
jgi:hypothetical protein